MSTATAETRPRSAPAEGGGAGQRRAQRAGLGTTADNASTAGQGAAGEDREVRRRERRREALGWRERLRGWSSLPRLRQCGRDTHGGAGGPVIRLSEGVDGSGRRAGVAGLVTCGSPWACPVCSRKISAERSREIADVLTAVAAAGGCAFLVTLTMRHRASQALVVLWTALSAAWRAVTSGRAVERERARWGVLGFVRVVESTHGQHGWHLHVHALVAFDTPVSVELARELGGLWFGRWSRALVRRGLAAPLEDRGGLDVRPVDLGAGSVAATADYLAKITAEVTASYAKDGRDGNRSPFAILRDALATGLAEDCELWIEWEQASRGRRQITWSRGLREWAGLAAEASDEEIAERDHGGDDVLAIEPQDWPRARAVLADLLDVAETDGADGLRAWLTDRGIGWREARPAPRREPPPPRPAVPQPTARTTRRNP